MDTNEMIKEAFRPLGWGRRIRRAFTGKVPPQTGLQRHVTHEGRLAAQAMKEFVTARPHVVQYAMKGQTGRLAREFKQHKASFLKGIDLDPMGQARVEKHLSFKPEVLSKQVIRHKRRLVRAPEEVPLVKKVTRPRDVVLKGLLPGLATGAGGAYLLGRNKEQAPPAPQEMYYYGY